MEHGLLLRASPYRRSPPHPVLPSLRRTRRLPAFPGKTAAVSRPVRHEREAPVPTGVGSLTGKPKSPPTLPWTRMNRARMQQILLYRSFGSGKGRGPRKNVTTADSPARREEKAFPPGDPAPPGTVEHDPGHGRRLPLHEKQAAPAGPRMGKSWPTMRPFPAKAALRPAGRPVQRLDCREGRDGRCRLPRVLLKSFCNVSGGSPSRRLAPPGRRSLKPPSFPPSPPLRFGP